ncbi:MAG: hypothetical protein G8345_13150, partial [Magnetococcales bacterium]|nr:hypothetical protein [Magnetococcales bacterium]
MEIPQHSSDIIEVIQRLSHEIDGIGIQIVDIAENVAEVSGKVAEQANMLDEFRDRMNALSLSNQNIKSVVQVT